MRSKKAKKLESSVAWWKIERHDYL